MKPSTKTIKVLAIREYITEKSVFVRIVALDMTANQRVVYTAWCGKMQQSSYRPIECVIVGDILDVVISEYGRLESNSVIIRPQSIV